MVNRGYKIITYGVYGFLLGLFFPVISTLAEINKHNMDISISSLRGLHLGQPLMLVIDAMPIILSASFALIGIQSARAYEASTQLNEIKNDQELQAQNEHYFLEALISSTSFAVVRLDTNHHIITCNAVFEELFGYTCHEVIGEHLDDMISSGDYYNEASQMSDSVSGGNLVRKISKRRRKNGSLVDVEIVGVPVTAAGEKIGILGLYHDISIRKQTEQALKVSEARFRTLFNESPISLWEEDFSEVKMILENIGQKEEIIERLDTDYELVQECIRAVKILDINQATIELYNAKSKSEILNDLDDVLVIDSQEEFRKELIALVLGETSYECEIYQKKLTGELIYGWLRLSIPPGYEKTWERVHISIVDITERKEAEEKLRFMSFHDALTGLYNRAYFEEEMARLSGSRQFPVSIIACDLDGLKQINDQFGHHEGDRAIKAAAKVLSLHTFRKEDVVARIGGDEFIVILPTVDLNENETIFDRINIGIENFNKSTIDDDLYRPISMSMGFAVIQEGGSLEEGYKAADKAMYLNKQKNKTK